MAEFQEVCKQWRRLCRSQEKEYQKCVDCPAGDYQMCELEISNIDDLDFQRTEEAVMAWAAEHPEPVYPTWSEYLHTQVKSHTVLRGFPDPDCVLDDLLHTPISADIAEKLGLKPKESV